MADTMLLAPDGPVPTLGRGPAVLIGGAMISTMLVLAVTMYAGAVQDRAATSCASPGATLRSWTTLEVDWSWAPPGARCTWDGERTEVSLRW